jgi:hypothetical protein
MDRSTVLLPRSMDTTFGPAAGTANGSARSRISLDGDCAEVAQCDDAGLKLLRWKISPPRQPEKAGENTRQSPQDRRARGTRGLAGTTPGLLRR